MKHFYICVFILLFSSSCKTKVEYLDEYQIFMNEVKNDWKSYSEEDWNEKTAQFENFNNNYNKKYREKLTPSEKVRIHRFDFAFHFYKGDISINKLFKGEYNDILKKYLTDFINEVKNILLEIGTFVKDIRAEGLVNIVNQLIE